MRGPVFRLSLATAAGFGVAMAAIMAVFLSGETFGQRCAKAYADPAEQEQCVKRLNAGGNVYRAPEPQHTPTESNHD